MFFSSFFPFFFFFIKSAQVQKLYFLNSTQTARIGTRDLVRGEGECLGWNIGPATGLFCWKIITKEGHRLFFQGGELELVTNRVEQSSWCLV